NVVLLSGSTVGSKTSTAMKYLDEAVTNQDDALNIQLFDLKNLDLSFSDGRNYLDYSGDTLELTTTLMQADVIFIGFPFFQASITRTLKKVFDFHPLNTFKDNLVCIRATERSPTHFLIAQTQLNPKLSYMKAYVMQTYVFIEERDFSNGTIVNADIIFRIND